VANLTQILPSAVQATLPALGLGALAETACPSGITTGQKADTACRAGTAENNQDNHHDGACRARRWFGCGRIAMMATVSNTANKTLEMFRETGAYLRGHFRLTSGLHSSEYLQCALVLQHPEYAEWIGRELARELTADRTVSLVAAPAIGGLIIGHEVARAMHARFIFTERDSEGRMTLRRGFSVEPGERAVIVEDVVTTGGSSREVLEILRAAGAEVIGAGSIIDRSGGHVDLGVPRMALATLKVVTYPPEACPLCREGVPVAKPGSRPSP
jgi:orotate phosphoribosyltransferase